MQQEDFTSQFGSSARRDPRARGSGSAHDAAAGSRVRAGSLAIFGLAYLLAAGFGQGLPLIPGVAITFWPPAGIFLAALLLNPRTHWFAYVLVAGFAELTCNQIWFHNPIHFAVIYFSANALEVLFAAWMLRRFAPHPFLLETPRDVATFVVIAGGVAPIIGATIIATTDAIIGKHDFATTWPLVWLGDGSGVLMTTPIALAVGRAWRIRLVVSRPRLLEGAAVALLLVGVAALAFSQALSTVYMTIPLLMWAAVRFQLQGAAAGLALVAVTAAVVTKLQLDGSAVPQDARLAEVVILQTFFAVAAVSALLTAALAHLHLQSATALQALTHDLERRVEERTDLLSWERARLAIALRAGRMGAYELSPGDDALWWSPELYPLYGVDPATFQPTVDAVLAFVHPDDRQGVVQKFAASPRHGEILDHEFRIVIPDGSVRWLLNRQVVNLGADGLSGCATGVVADITDRKAAEAALRESEARLSGVLQQSPAGIMQTDASGCMTLVNKRWCDMLGYPEAELLGRTVLDVTHPDSITKTVKAIERLIAGGPDFQLEKTYQRKDGSQFSAQSNLSAIRSVAGEYQGLRSVVLDMTDRLQSEKTLREKEHFLQRITEVMPGVLQVFDLKEMRSVFINRSLAQLLGFSPDEVNAMGAHAARLLMHPDDLPGFEQHLERVLTLADGEVADFEHRMRDRAGDWHWFHSHDAVFARDATGAVQQLIGVASEISARKQAEAALREREERLRLILDGSVAFMGVMEPDGTLIEANASALSAGGLARAEVLDRKLWENAWFNHDPKVIKQIKDAVRRVADGETVRQDVSVRVRGDTRMTIDFMLAPVLDDAGRVHLLVPSGFDITERKRAETALRRSRDTYLNLIESNPFGVYLIDSDFRVARVSTGAKRAFENVDPLIGRDFAEVLRIIWQEPFASEVTALFRRTLQTGEKYHSKDTMERRGDLDRDESYDWQIERVTLPDGSHGVVCYFYDMTDRRRHEEQIQYLMGEVNHRAKNLLAVVQAIAAQTARTGDPATFAVRLSERIHGLAAGHDLLVRNQWEGVGVAELVQAQLAHLADMFDNRVVFDGPQLRLSPSAAQGIGMALHEMGTNAIKYGAVSNAEGRIRITWGIAAEPEPSFSMQWIEDGGPEVTPPKHEGFGTRVIQRMVEGALAGVVVVEYRKEGFIWTLNAPLSNLTGN